MTFEELVRKRWKRSIRAQKVYQVTGVELESWLREFWEARRKRDAEIARGIHWQHYHLPASKLSVRIAKAIEEAE